MTRKRAPFDMGYTAGRLYGENGAPCPFEKTTREHREWHRGYATACDVTKANSPTIPIYRTSEAPNDNSKAVGDFTRVLKDQGMLDETGRVKR